MAASVLPPVSTLMYLDEDCSESCPVGVAKLRRHVAASLGEGGERGISLRFLRTARIGEMKYWLWIVRSRQGLSYATVLVEPDGAAWMRYHPSPAGSDPERLLIEDYRSAFEP